MTVFALVIAVAKDLPDVEGDRKYQVREMSSVLLSPFGTSGANIRLSSGRGQGIEACGAGSYSSPLVAILLSDSGSVQVLLSNYAMGVAVGFWAQSVNKVLMVKTSVDVPV